MCGRDVSSIIIAFLEMHEYWSKFSIITVSAHPILQ